MPSKVGPYGPLDAKIAIVGEAPGMDEVDQGRPFVGAAGQQLRRSCSDAKLSLSEIYLTNVIKERPIQNRIAQFIDLKSKTPIHKEGYDEYESLLHEELSRLPEVNVIVPVGNIPLYALTRKRGILKWRGSILEVSIKGRVFKIIPTIHPAALLPGRGEYIWRYFVRADLIRIKEQSEFPEVRGPGYVLKLDPTYEETMAFLKETYSEHGTVYFDIENWNGEVSCISFSHTRGHSICIPFIRDGQNNYTIEQEVKIWKAIGLVLEAPFIQKVAQNSAYDGDFLFGKYGIVTAPLGDTMIQHSILYPEMPRSLAFMTSIYTEQSYYKDIGQKVFSERSNK